ncbi:MAG: hypothetical protein AAF697_02310 [Pseudomonadota bacterium]
MHKLSNPKTKRHSHFFLIGVAFVAIAYVATAPGSAQASNPLVDAVSQTAMAGDPSMSEAQKVEHDSWTADKQAEYAAWPAETKAYYWSLSSERRMMFWALADSDKIALTAMTGPERDAAWERIEARAGPAPSAG